MQLHMYNVVCRSVRIFFEEPKSVEVVLSATDEELTFRDQVLRVRIDYSKLFKSPEGYFLFQIISHFFGQPFRIYTKELAENVLLQNFLYGTWSSKSGLVSYSVLTRNRDFTSRLGIQSQNTIAIFLFQPNSWDMIRTRLET